MNTGNTNLETFIRAMLVAALWSTNDESTPSGGEPLDRNYSPEDFSTDALETLRAHATSFFFRTACFIATEPVVKPDDGDRWGTAGHDFWLTSQGHGAGFWDGDWPVYGELLTKTAQCYPTIDISVGDDGKLHV